MTIKDDISEELRKGVPFAEIRRKHRSQSQMYEAVREFLEDADKIIHEKQSELREVGGKLVKAKAERKSLCQEKKKTFQIVEELKRKEEKLTTEVARNKKMLQDLNADISDLKAKGFTAEILTKIKEVEDRSGPELLALVKTAEKFKPAKMEHSRLQREKTSLNAEIKKLRAKKQALKEKTNSEKNRFDEMKLKAVTYKDAVATVQSLLQDGYSTDDIKSLKSGLDTFGIKGDSNLSLMRLVNGLKNQRTLVTLQDKLDRKSEELAELEKAVANVKTELDVAKEMKEAFQEVKNAGLEAITNASSYASEEITKSAEQFDSRSTESLNKINNHALQTMVGVREELGEWGQLQQQKGELREFIAPGRTLLGIVESDTALKEVSLPLVTRLLERAHLWTLMHQPNAIAKPSSNILAQQPLGFLAHLWYKIPVLLEFAYEGLKQVMIEENQQVGDNEEK